MKTHLGRSILNSGLVLMVLLCTSVSIRAEKNIFTIKTERDSYQIKEKVYYEVINQSPKEQIPYVISAQKLEGKNWQTTRLDTTCPCGALCKEKDKPIGTFGMMQKKWDQKTSECLPPLPGRYRLVVLGHWDTKTKRQFLNGVSNEFVISEVP